MRKFSATIRSFGLMLSFLCLTLGALAQSVIKGTVRSSANALDGASVVLEGKDIGTRTNLTGSYEIKTRPGAYTVVFSYVGYITQKKTVTLTVGQTLSLDVVLEKEKELQPVAVVGSRSQTVRTNTQTAAPVDVFSVKELQMTGQIEPTQMINFVAPSFNSSRQTISDGTDHIDPATLRGLGPDQVLVLVNGRRRHNTALMNVNGTIGRGSVGTDLNAIPASAIERIEVLRDGASSQYGSDAIAGVINIVLKKDKKKTGLNLHAGQQYAGDGTTYGLSYNKGMRLGKKGFFDVFADMRLRDATNRSGDFTGTVYYNIPGNATQQVRDSLIRLDNQVINERGFSRKKNMLIGNSAVDNYSVMVNGGIPISSRANMTFTAGTNYREGSAAGFYRYPKQTSQVIADLYPDGFLPFINSTIRDNNAAIGFDWVGKKGWNWDASSSYGSNSFRFVIDKTNNASQYALGENAPTKFIAGKLRFAQSVTNVNFSKDLAKAVNLKTFNLAFGGELRTDNYQIAAGEPGSYLNFDPASGRAGGAQVFPGFQPANAVDQTRYVTAGYVDLESDVNDNFLFNVAGRYENYSDFGGNFAGKASVRYKFSDAFSVRSTVSNGFRAPSMHQRYFSAISTVFVNTTGGLVPLQQGTFRNGSPVANAFGIPSLEAETSMSYSVGVTSKPAKNVTITVDAYQIDIKDRIVLTGSFVKSNPLVNTILSGYPDINSAIFFTNAIDTRTRGLDIVMNSTHKLGKGNLDITFAGNLNKTEVVGNIKSSPVLAADPTLANGVLFNMEERGRIERGQPRDKFTLNFNYKINNWNLMLRNTRFGRVATIFNGTDRTRDEFYSPKVVTDASIAYKPIHWMTVTLGANNITDVYPDPQRNPANNGEGRFVYSRGATQFGFNGGYYYTNLGFDLTDIKRMKKAKPAPVAPIVKQPEVAVTKPADTDGDGVDDASDKCPNVAGPKIFNGCPDSDGDGVEDSKDKCPAVAGSKLFDGCPDSDGDGVENSKDKCPNTYGAAKYDGCPVPDSDGDGVNDEYDKCPTVAGNIANNGCPVTKEEKQAKVDMAAKSIYFETGSAKLKAASNGALDDVATLLNDDADLQLEVEGHTDNVGSAASNKVLSQKRAEAVKSYLTGKGIPASRIDAVGYGFDNPVATNKTADGRALNRRVVLKLK
jgi:iron complex outermembrane receptor protein